MLNSGQKTAHVLICLSLFVAAFVLRSVGMDYGYFMGDERINEAARVLAGDLIPGQHFYPPFLNYLNAVSFVGLFGYGLLSDLWGSTGEFKQAYYDDPLPFYLTARYVTAGLSALSAPLFYAIARRVGLSPVAAISVGLFAVLFPLSVFLSHLAKGDIGMAVACLAVVWAFLVRLDSGPNRWVHVLIGIAVVLAVSFKHSAALLLVPFAIAMIVVLTRRESFGAALSSFLMATLVAAILWPVLNIGILLDFDGFLEFQKIQTVMSVKEEDGFGAGWPVTFLAFGRSDFGMNAVMLAFCLVAPVWFASANCRLDHKDALLSIWIACFVATVVTSFLVGTRQPEQLFVANQMVFLCLTAIAVMDMIRSYRSLSRAIVGLAGIAGLAIMVMASLGIKQQALATPGNLDVADFLSVNYPDAKIHTGIALPVPQTKEAQRFEIDEDNRVAARYGIEMPVIAAERFIQENAPNALFHVDAPFAMSGLEDDDAAQSDLPAVPYAWPTQPDQWQLDNWLNQGFSIFVVNHLEHIRVKSRSSLVKAFYLDVEARCALVQVIDARKPLFLEYELKVFDCGAV